MSTRSKFERDLHLNYTGYSIKIPDAGIGYKPYDYIYGVSVEIAGKRILRLLAIEAKRARGWTLLNSSILEHQIRALDYIESLAPNSAWLAIGFLDIPKMKLNHKRQPILKKRKSEAFMIRWTDAEYIMGETSISYADIITIDRARLEWRKVKTRYRWIIPETHYLYDFM